MKKEWVTYCLRLLVLLVLTCNAGGVFATTISSNTTLSSATSYSGDVTVNPGVTLTITSEVTITGNLTNNGGTIIVGEGGVLTVNGDVTNSSAYSTTEYTESTNISESDVSTGNNKRNHITTTTITRTPEIIGSISVVNGGSITVNNDFSNASNLSISSTEADKISKITVNGTFTNTTENITGYNTVQTTTVTQPQTYSWFSWSNSGSSTSSTSTTNNSISATAVGTLNLSNGYLLVDGNLNLQDNSTVTFAGSGIGEGVESTIRVRNINGTEGNVTQSENAVITLASGAKGELIVAGTYTDNTTTDDNHPWEITDDGTLVMESGFDLYVQKYMSARLTDKIDEISDLLDNLNEQLNSIDGKTLDEYLQVLYPDSYTTYLTGKYNNAQTYEQHYNSFSQYMYREQRSALGALFDFFGALIGGGNSGYNSFVSNLTIQQKDAIDDLKSQIETNTALKETLEDLQETLENEGVQASEIATQSSSVSSILPIELTSFTVSATEYGYTFNWVTASEVENDYFTLEFSEDGEEFIAIDYVFGAGTTSETTEYEYVWDANPTADILYFRLKQTDYNGEFTYSDILVYAPKKSHGATRILYYGPLKLNVVDGQLQYIVE